MKKSARRHFGLWRYKDRARKRDIIGPVVLRSAQVCTVTLDFGACAKQMSSRWQGRIKKVTHGGRYSPSCEGLMLDQACPLQHIRSHMSQHGRIGRIGRLVDIGMANNDVNSLSCGIHGFRLCLLAGTTAWRFLRTSRVVLVRAAVIVGTFRSTVVKVATTACHL